MPKDSDDASDVALIGSCIRAAAQLQSPTVTGFFVATGDLDSVMQNARKLYRLATAAEWERGDVT